MLLTNTFGELITFLLLFPCFHKPNFTLHSKSTSRCLLWQDDPRSHCHDCRWNHEYLYPLRAAGGLWFQCQHYIPLAQIIIFKYIYIYSTHQNMFKFIDTGQDVVVGFSVKNYLLPTIFMHQHTVF